MDIQAISAVLSSIRTATDIANLIKNSDISLEKAETKLKLAELISALADAKIEITEIQQMLVEKDVEIRAAKEQLAVKDKLKWEKPCYWLVENGNKDGPFCQNCYDAEKKLIRLQGSGDGFWECKACKNHYTDDSWNPPGPMTTGRNWSPFDDF